MDYKKKLILFVVLINVLSLSYAMKKSTPAEQADTTSQLKSLLYSSQPVKMPSELILKKRLTEMGFYLFAEESGILKIADKMKYPNEIPTVVERASQEYLDGGSGLALFLGVIEHKENIIRAILKDYPQSITELENDGWIKRSFSLNNYEISQGKQSSGLFLFLEIFCFHITIFGQSTHLSNNVFYYFLKTGLPDVAPFGA